MTQFKAWLSLLAQRIDDKPISAQEEMDHNIEEDDNQQAELGIYCIRRQIQFSNIEWKHSNFKYSTTEK